MMSGWNDSESMVLWLPNPRGEGVMARLGDSCVFPSNPGQNAPKSFYETRTELPPAGLFEECGLFGPTEKGCFVAYPVKGGSRAQLPGVFEPFEITWEQNARFPDDPTQVIYTYNFTFGSYDKYCRIFAGEGRYFERTYIDHERATTWTKLPRAGDTSLCLINWIQPEKGMPVGYAYPAVSSQPVPVRQHEAAYMIGPALLIIREGEHPVKAWKEGDEIHIVIS